MNPEEGSLRPQLLDRFGLMVSITAETDKSLRNDLLHTLLEYDKALFQKQQRKSAPLLDDAYKKNQKRQQELKNARQKFNEIALSDKIKACCVDLAAELKVEGHRGEYVMALAAQAYAALENAPQVALEHLEAVIPLSVQHRRPEFLQGGRANWTEDDNNKVTVCLSSTIH
jgi:magnesium chelatase subunit I